MIDPVAPRISGLQCLRMAIHTVPIPGAPPRLSKDGAAVGLAFLDIALRQNHIRRLTERLTLVEHRTARCTTEVDISLGMLEQDQREATLLYQRIRSRGTPWVGQTSNDDAGGHRRNVIWVPVSLARRSHAPVDVIDGHGVKLPRLTQYETSRLMASAMYRLFRLILTSHPDVTDEKETALRDFLYRVDEPRWLLQAALVTLLTERNKPAAEAGVGRVSASDELSHRTHTLAVLRDYEHVLKEYIELLDLVVNDYLMVVALDPSQDEHMLAFDSPLHIERRPRRSILLPLRVANGPYWVQYRTRLPANLRAYHLVAQTEDGLVIDTMSLSTNADDSIVKSLEDDLANLSRRLPTVRDRATDARVGRAVDLEVQGAVHRLSEVVRRRTWDASKANLSLATRHLRTTRTLVDALMTGRMETITSERLAKAAKELKTQRLELDFTVETEPPSPRAHVYWRRDPSRADLGRSIDITTNVFIRDSSGYRPGNVTRYVLSVVGITYVLACLRFGSPWPFGPLWPSGGLWPIFGPVDSTNLTSSEGIIAVLLLVPGFLYARLKLPEPQSIAGQVRKLARLVAHATIATAALAAATVAATTNVAMVQVAFAAALAVPLLAVALMYLGSRAVVREMLPVTAELPVWVRRSAPANRALGQRLKRIWRWRPTMHVPDVTFNTLDQVAARKAWR